MQIRFSHSEAASEILLTRVGLSLSSSEWRRLLRSTTVYLIRLAISDSYSGARKTEKTARVCVCEHAKRKNDERWARQAITYREQNEKIINHQLETIEEGEERRRRTLELFTEISSKTFAMTNFVRSDDNSSAKLTCRLSLETWQGFKVRPKWPIPW